MPRRFDSELCESERRHCRRAKKESSEFNYTLRRSKGAAFEWNNFEYVNSKAERMGATQPIPNDPLALAAMIDHTLLKPEATTAQIDQLCDEARSFGFASVCVNPTFVSHAAARLHGCGVEVCTVVGFPLGAHVSDIKAAEARRALDDGATELDMVLNVGALKNGEDSLVESDIRAVVDSAHTNGALCKVILETCLLTDEEKRRACAAAIRAGADFVKTSTGFSSGGATIADVALMHDAVHAAGVRVKASGGIRSLADMRSMIGAGATRIGASAGVAIMRELKEGASRRENAGGGSGEY
jgi:deoxyribose-phosphate aldolase